MWAFMTILTLVSIDITSNKTEPKLMIQAVIVECVSTVWWHYALAKLLVGTGIGSVQATIPVVRGFVLLS